ERTSPGEAGLSGIRSRTGGSQLAAAGSVRRAKTKRVDVRLHAAGERRRKGTDSDDARKPSLCGAVQVQPAATLGVHQRPSDHGYFIEGTLGGETLVLSPVSGSGFVWPILI